MIDITDLFWSKIDSIESDSIGKLMEVAEIVSLILTQQNHNNTKPFNKGPAVEGLVRLTAFLINNKHAANWSVVVVTHTCGRTVQVFPLSFNDITSHDRPIRQACIDYMVVDKQEDIVSFIANELDLMSCNCTRSIADVRTKMKELRVKQQTQIVDT